MALKNFGFRHRGSFSLSRTGYNSTRRLLIGAIALLSILSLADANVTVAGDPSPSGDSIGDVVKKYHCRGRALCKGSKGVELLPPEKMSDLMIHMRPCFCDKDCNIFGECCADLVVNVTTDDEYLQSNATNYTTTTQWPVEETGYGDVKMFQGIPTSQWGCHRLNLPRNKSEEWAYLVHSCPYAYWDKNVVAMCSERHLIPNEVYDYLLDLPVVSSLTGIPYLNSYCMTCNEEMSLPSPFYPMTLHLFCTERGLREDQIHQDTVYVRGERMWLAEGWNCTLEISDARNVFFGVGEGVDPDRPGNYTRRCLPREDSCDGEDEELAKKCASYALYVKPKQGKLLKVYKNPHCAFCQGKKREDLSCISTFASRRSSRFKFPSFSEFFQIRWDGGAIGVERHQCPPDRVWDVIFKKCIVVRCKIGAMLREGRCEDYVGQASEPYPWNASCDGNSSGSDPGCREQGEEEVEDGLAFHSRVQGYLTVVCMSVSIVCLALHIATYSALPKLRNLPGRNLLALSWALLVAQVVVVASGVLSSSIDSSQSSRNWMCVMVAVVIHFFYLSAIFWMNVMSVDVWRTFSSSSSHHHLVGGHETAKRLHMWYAAYAWGAPMVFVVVTLAVDLIPSHSSPSLEFIKPRYGHTDEGFCWISNKVGVAIFFSIPTFGLLLANAALFAVSVYRIHENQESRRYMRKRAMEEEFLCNARLSKAASRESDGPLPTPDVPRRQFRQSTTTSCISVKDKSRLYLYVKLGIIMGFTWVCAFIAGFTQIRELWYPFIVLNGLQGAFIFVMFDVKKKVLEMLWERVTGKKPEWTNSSSRSSGLGLILYTRRAWGRRSRGFHNRSTTETSSKGKSSSTTGRTSLSTTPAKGGNDAAVRAEHDSFEIEEVDNLQVRLRNMSNKSNNGIILSPNFFPESQPTFSYCTSGSEVVKEPVNVPSIPEEGETSLNSVQEEENPLVSYGRSPIASRSMIT